MDPASASSSACGPPSSGNRGRFILHLPPGFHFSPTEDELVVDYLRRKIAGLPPPLPIFKDLCINSYRPEQIVEKYRKYGENRWYFFTTRKRKYATGNRPDRTTPGKGFWKATGGQRKIHSGGKLVGRRRTLVFYTQPEKGEEEDEGPPAPEEMDEDIEETALSKLVKTNWIMYEYENLNSEAEAADKNIDKIGEWVLCTIQKSQRCDDEKNGKKKEEGNEGSTAGGIGTVEGSPGSGDGEEGNRAGGKKRKRKEKINANNGTDQSRQAGHPRKRSKTPMPPQEQPYLNTVAPASEGDDHNIAPNMSMVEYSSHPTERSPMPMQPYEPPHTDSEMMPPIRDDYCIGPNMVPAPWQEPPYSEMMMFPPVGGSYNIGSGSNMMPMPWQQGPPLSEMISPLLGDTYRSIAPDMVPRPSQESTHYSEMTSPHVGDSYNKCPNMATYQHTNYLQPDAAVVYGGVAQSHNMAGHSNDGYAFDGLLRASNNGYSYPLRSYAAGTNTLAMFMNNGVRRHNHGGFFAGYQYHGAPSVHGPSRAVGSAAAPPW